MTTTRRNRGQAGNVAANDNAGNSLRFLGFRRHMARLPAVVLLSITAIRIGAVLGPVRTVIIAGVVHGRLGLLPNVATVDRISRGGLGLRPIA